MDRPALNELLLHFLLPRHLRLTHPDVETAPRTLPLRTKWPLHHDDQRDDHLLDLPSCAPQALVEPWIRRCRGDPICDRLLLLPSGRFPGESLWGDALQIAYYITGTNDEDGVAEAVRKFVFYEEV